MFQLLVPLALFVAARYTRQSGNSAGPKPTPPPGATLARVVHNLKLKQQAAAAPKPAAAKPRPKPKQVVRPVIGPVVIEHPDVTPAGQAPLQAAVDAAVTQAIRSDPYGEDIKPAAAPAKPTKRTPKQAALDLQKFLLKTGRHGTLKDRPPEVKAAQIDLGLKPDGIVGKRTRLAAEKQGVALPPANPAKK